MKKLITPFAMLFLLLCFLSCEKETFSLREVPTAGVLLYEDVPMQIPPNLRDFLDLDTEEDFLFIPFQDTIPYESLLAYEGDHFLDSPLEERFLRPAQPVDYSATARLLAYSVTTGSRSGDPFCEGNMCSETLAEAIATYQELADASCRPVLLGHFCCVDEVGVVEYLIYITPICHLPQPAPNSFMPEQN